MKKISTKIQHLLCNYFIKLSALEKNTLTKKKILPRFSLTWDAYCKKPNKIKELKITLTNLQHLIKKSQNNNKYLTNSTNKNNNKKWSFLKNTDKKTKQNQYNKNNNQKI